MASRRDARALAQPLALERVKASSEATLTFNSEIESIFEVKSSFRSPVNYCLLLDDDRVISLQGAERP